MKGFISCDRMPLAFGLTLFFASGCSTEFKDKKYLSEVLDNLNQIESARYYATSTTWAPGDDKPSGIQHRYVKEFNNPSDTTIGASFVALSEEDTTELNFCYDGKMRAMVYEDKTLVIDSFKVRELSFRPLRAPFFNYAKSIIK